MELTLERKTQQDKTVEIGTALLTPEIDEDYWTYRVRLTDTQAIVGFPKFSTIGIGFAVEEDWNTNLPYRCEAEEIYNHIAHNAGDPSIEAETVLRAIEMVQLAAREDRGE